MSAALDETVVVDEADALEIRESVSLQEGALRPDGLVAIHVIRPGLGRGRGRHLYEADMLERNAAVFKGWKMYVDHQSPEARRASGGLPRSIRDLGGIIKEAYWDPNVPPDPQRGHGKGAVIGLTKPTRLVRSLIEDDPALVEASVSATATGVKPVQHAGQTAWLVEGFNPKGSVDWVTEAGAGGKVVALLESVIEESRYTEEELAAMTDDELRAWIQENRPEVLAEAGDGNDGDGDDAELEALITKLTPKFRGNRKLAEKAAKKQLEEAHNEGGDDVAEITADALREALETDADVRDLFEAVVDERVEAHFGAIKQRLGTLVEAAVADELELRGAEDTAGARRVLELRDMQQAAHELIAGSGLPNGWQEQLREEFAIVNGEPTPGLNVVGELDGDKVVKSATDVVRETVEQRIATEKRKLAEALPRTAVRGQGPSVVREGESDTETGDGDGDGDGGKAKGAKKDVEEAKTTGSRATDELLEVSGISPDPEIYAGIFGDR